MMTEKAATLTSPTHSSLHGVTPSPPQTLLPCNGDAAAPEPAVEHCERFEVITAPDGSSRRSYILACATAQEHYQRTTAKEDDDNNNNNKKKNNINGTSEFVAENGKEREVCATGLRVYEGAQVMASFLVQYGLAFRPCPASAAAEETEEMVIVELGCGCGLVGLTAADVLSATSSAAATASTSAAEWGAVKRLSNGDAGEEQQRRTTVVFTDGSTSCLSLVRRSGALNGVTVADGAEEGDDADSRAACHRITFPLLWSDDGAAALRSLLRRRRAPAAPGVDLLLGSDIMYYKVDIHALLQTARQLLFDDSKDSSAAAGEAPSPAIRSFFVLCHIMRIPDGHRKLATLARRLGFGLARVPLRAFLDAEAVLLPRGWASMELVILFRRQHPHTNGEEKEEEEEDARVVRAALAQRAAAWRQRAESTPGGGRDVSRAAADQAASLAGAVAPYGAEALRAHEEEETAESAFSNFML